MKKIVILFLVLVCGINLYSQINNNLVEYIPNEPYIPRFLRSNVLRSNVLDDGTYEAIVEYRNYSTQTSSKYSLTVVVVNDRVIQINFGNGGNINYKSPNIQSYSGGQLRFTTDLYGDITGATTTVTVRELNGSTLNFRISLN